MPRPLARTEAFVRQLVTDGRRGVETLRVHKLRSLLTMLGMIFGVAAVVSMMSIGAGAQREVLTLIEQLGVRNLIVEAREATDFQAFQKVRKTSPGLTERDLRVIRARCRRSTESSRTTARSQACGSRRGVSSTLARQPSPRRSACWAKARGRRSSVRETR
jgi:hypothetical protein